VAKPDSHHKRASARNSIGVTGLPRDEDQRTGSGDEKNGIGNELRNKPVMEVAQIIIILECNIRVRYNVY
jgi:hypothetical protein